MGSYCTEADVKSILSEHGVTAFTDDDLDGVSDGTLIDDAIEREGSLRIDFALCQRYNLVDLSGNTYLKWANAILAACDICTRRNMPLPESLARQQQMIMDQLGAIHSSGHKLPGQREQMDHLPAVTNYDVERFRGLHPVRTQTEESTGDYPTPPTRRWPARPRIGRDY